MILRQQQKKNAFGRRPTARFEIDLILELLRPQNDLDLQMKILMIIFILTISWS